MALFNGYRSYRMNQATLIWGLRKTRDESEYIKLHEKRTSSCPSGMKFYMKKADGFAELQLKFHLTGLTRSMLFM